jgi:hypothetical protein
MHELRVRAKTDLSSERGPMRWSYFITLLAYHLLHAIRFQLRQKGVRFCWTTIRRQLSTQIRVTTTMKRKDGKIIHIRKSSKAEQPHQAIYDALNLSHQPVKKVKQFCR